MSAPFPLWLSMIAAPRFAGGITGSIGAPFFVGQAALAAVVKSSALIPPHRRPPANRINPRESQPILPLNMFSDGHFSEDPSMHEWS
jgi:hypothetical protein